MLNLGKSNSLYPAPYYIYAYSTQAQNISYQKDTIVCLDGAISSSTFVGPNAINNYAATIPKTGVYLITYNVFFSIVAKTSSPYEEKLAWIYWSGDGCRHAYSSQYDCIPNISSFGECYPGVLSGSVILNCQAMQYIRLITYVTAPNRATGATFRVAVVENAIYSATVLTGGTNYTTGDELEVIGGSGSGAKFRISANNGVVSGVTVVNGGYGYATLDVVSVNKATSISSTNQPSILTITYLHESHIASS